ncbi:Regulatory protein recX [Weissella viridescens]|uniref:Regulatory protein recX n=1 Tax=Weissella viridescens TaxID=1629 RepID=A0A380NYC8_WEIVI|nr:Regulatory protein recX [Weissella viridescens]
MPVVTKVTQQKRPGRYNIYLDDEFAIAVDENILIRFDLFKGTEVSDTMLAEVQAAEYEQKLMRQVCYMRLGNYGHVIKSI